MATNEILAKIEELTETLTITAGSIRSGELDSAAEALGDVCEFDGPGAVESVHAAIRALEM